MKYRGITFDESFSYVIDYCDHKQWTTDSSLSNTLS